MAGTARDTDLPPANWTESDWNFPLLQLGWAQQALRTPGRYSSGSMMNCNG
jgi:hypothetical protein